MQGSETWRRDALSIETEDRWLLRGEHFGPPSAPVVVVLGHAMMVDRRTMDSPRGAGLGSTLASTGLEVLIMDARGHGESGPGAKDGARWSYDDIVRYDVPAMVRAAREHAAGRPVVLLGHSLIGHAGLIAAGLDPDNAPDALIAYGPNLWLPRLEPHLLVRCAKGTTLAAWKIVSQAAGYFDSRALRIGSAPEALPYIEQFASMWRDDRLTGRSDEEDYARYLARAKIPVLAVASDGDRFLARPESVRAYLSLAVNADVELRILTGGGAPDHMGFVTNRRSAPLWTETAHWILSRFAGPAPSAA